MTTADNIIDAVLPSPTFWLNWVLLGVLVNYKINFMFSKLLILGQVVSCLKIFNVWSCSQGRLISFCCRREILLQRGILFWRQFLFLWLHWQDTPFFFSHIQYLACAYALTGIAFYVYCKALVKEDWLVSVAEGNLCCGGEFLLQRGILSEDSFLFMFTPCKIACVCIIIMHWQGLHCGAIMAN